MPTATRRITYITRATSAQKVADLIRRGASHMKSFHVSNFGFFNRGFRPDMDGYVHLTIAAVMAGNYDTAFDLMTRDRAREIAADNRESLKNNTAALEEWRRSK